MSKAVVLLMCFIAIGSFAQNVSGVVFGPHGDVISNAEVIDKDLHVLSLTNEKGEFKLVYSEGSVFGIRKKGYESSWFLMNNPSKTNYEVRLTYAVQELDEVNVFGRKRETVADLKNVNILDYLPTEKGLITLRKTSGEYYIGLDSIPGEGTAYKLNFDRPKRLFRDCLGNYHILNSEFAIQFDVSDTGFAVIDIASIPQFEYLLAPCIGAYNDSTFVMKYLTRHNQQLDLVLFEKGKKPISFYRQFDSISYRMAAEDALIFGINNSQTYIWDSLNQNVLPVRRYLREVAKENPDIVLKFVSNSINAEHSNRPADLLTNYLLHSYPIDVRAFQVRNYIVVVDFEDKGLRVFSDKGKELHYKPFKVEGDIKDVWKDASRGLIYFYARYRGNHRVYQLDVTTGQTRYLMNFRELPFAESKQVYDGWLYYREIENGFFKVHRISL